jgi:DNA-binding MarR family transcriptional regulator
LEQQATLSSQDGQRTLGVYANEQVTSNISIAELTARATASQLRVYVAVYTMRMALGRGPTGREIADFLGIARHRVSGRLTELRDLGLIVDDGRVEDPTSHKNVRTWRAGA